MNVYVVVLTEDVPGVGVAGDFLQCRWREAGTTALRMLWWGRQKPNRLRIGPNAAPAMSLLDKLWPGIPYRFQSESVL